jgi:clan AA aspartic protease (TIGR02281 family)
LLLAWLADGACLAFNQLKLDVVKVGSIQLRNVTAVVMDGAQATDVLLGMSFLGHVELINKGNKLVLRRKY